MAGEQVGGGGDGNAGREGLFSLRFPSSLPLAGGADADDAGADDAWAGARAHDA